ncbi:hypothetical protein AB0I53_19595 [Saccharopolyspora sp. NPDC050389]|uniref:hypothetical protein n=1 Tax=Saccharopolyspora sp. NPDC050389 TaxID=3155516 RepID=UPI0033C2ED8F
MDAMADVVTPAVTALSQAATTDAWKGLCAGLVRIFSRGDDSEAERAGDDLDRTREKFIDAIDHEDNDRVERLKARLALQIQEFLDDYPDEAEAIRELVEGYETVDGSADTVHNVVNKSIALFHGKAISGYNVNVNLPSDS